MQVSHSFEEFQDRVLPSLHGKPVVTVGSFDGVHLGHQFLIHELVHWARSERRPAVIVTFVTHPRSVVDGSVVRRLLPPEQKLRLLRDLGADAVVMVEFDSSLRELDAESFCRQVVVEKLGASGLLLGHNNRIGRDREGTPERLREIGAKIGLEIRQAARVEVDGLPISSTAIRDHIERGDFLWPRKMLGRPYTLRGTIVTGRKLGRTIGFPTINLPLDGVVHPPKGVYGVLVALQRPGGGSLAGPVAGRWRGAANLGVRPTVETGREVPLLEVHLLDFAGEIYGLEAEVEFICLIRAEQKFAGLDALKAQLAIDVEQTRKRLTVE